MKILKRSSAEFLSILWLSLLSKALSFFTQRSPVSTNMSPKSKSPMFEYLKFDNEPKFDVLKKTIEYVSNRGRGEPNEDIYAEDYVLRGPVIGPINRSDLVKSQNSLGISAAFPDIKIDTFGYTIDPENSYRCFYFQRWRGTHSVDLDSFGTIYPSSGIEMETPVSVFSVVFNPEGKIVYEQVGSVVDRHEGNTKGKAAVFGMLHTAGLKLDATPGNKGFALVQRLGHLMGNMGRSWSEEQEIPQWWNSKSRGADATEQW